MTIDKTPHDRRISKALSFWLRHDPDAGEISVDPMGWAEVDSVLQALERDGLPSTAEDLARVVADSDKNRFELAADGQLIRARQGHSIPVMLKWPVTKPPENLFHGTVKRFLSAILAEGLRPMARHHVHLSPDRDTASAVGARRGKPVILCICSGSMAADGHQFRLSGNGVWLTDHVPQAYIYRSEHDDI
ncbi:RNA--NAD 2'-phosphotransferase [Altererythrobacter xixiisoli]|uniref:Probable RNA 2'-phosphotransferase n=1 Tax=Croceibacterium xixiisoli TaxID=1476466 RepID=A0A6I4TWX0_9SPHN|nr:RNA 2'-phosphotransferase [Croceibacterium xixiisoli]MXO98823.1 RNA--NAD 2'-phosphotransferase [Croceibacterium xixiisoli]